MKGNLGLYLWLTRIAKKLGGPIGFLIVTLATGALIYKGLEVVITAIVEAVRKERNNLESEPIYTVCQDAVSEDGMSFSIGNQFRVLIRDGEFALVERLGDEEHRILPVSFLAGISDYAQV